MITLKQAFENLGKRVYFIYGTSTEFLHVSVVTVRRVNVKRKDQGTYRVDVEHYDGRVTCVEPAVLSMTPPSVIK